MQQITRTIILLLLAAIIAFSGCATLPGQVPVCDDGICEESEKLICPEDCKINAGQGTLEVTVTDESGSPIENATVIIKPLELSGDPISIYTDSSGFATTKLERGGYGIEVEKKGYDKQLMEISIEPNQSTRRTAALSRRVVCGNGTVEGNEACDYQSEIVGCQGGQYCNYDCLCEDVKFCDSPPQNSAPGIELDIPDYYPAWMKKPAKFFSGRAIKIYTRQEFAGVRLKSSDIQTSARPADEIIENLTIKKKKSDSFAVTIPANTNTGDYKIEISSQTGNVLESIPIHIIGIEDTETKFYAGSGIAGRGVLFTKKLGCPTCYWELTSAANPLNENYAYIVGGGSSDNFLYTEDGWQTQSIQRINGQTPNIQKLFRGDPKLEFTPDNRLIVASLLTQQHPKGNGELITGGLFTENSANSNPIVFTQKLISEVPEDLAAQDWIIFDYEKIAVDKNPESPYYGNTYVFANAVKLEADSVYSQGIFVIGANGEILASLRPSNITGIAVTSAAVAKDGTVFAIIPNSPQLTLATSHDGGKTFEYREIEKALYAWTPPLISLTSQRQLYGLNVVISVDKQDNIYIAYSYPKQQLCTSSEFNYAGKDFDIFVIKSTDKGLTWSDPVIVNDDSSGGDQIFPSMTIDSDGVLHVSFLDHRDNQDKGQFDVYYAKSEDMGGTFSQNVKVNDAPILIFYGGREIGDYLDMISTGNSKIYIAYPCWNSDIKANDTCVSVLAK